MWSVFPFSATPSFFRVECPGCFQIKWISCFGTLKKPWQQQAGEWRQMNDRIDTLFCVGFLFKEKSLLQHVPFKCWFLLCPVLLITVSLYIVIDEFAANLNQFWKYFIQFLCFCSSVLTHYINPRNFSPFYLHQPSHQNNIELAPRPGTIQLSRIRVHWVNHSGLRPIGGSCCRSTDKPLSASSVEPSPGFTASVLWFFSAAL